jgi:AAA family ATP:ADP antiporter
LKALGHPLSRTAASDRRAAAWASVTFFLLLAAYYVLRPLRDEMAVRVGTSRLGLLFSATFIGMLCAAPLFGWCAARVRPSVLVPGVFGVFAMQLALFNAAMQGSGFGLAGSAVFFVWISIFNVFAVSVFWSLLTERFGLDAAERLFGPISVGGSLGAVVGPSLTALLAEPLGVARLPLVSMTLLVGAVGCAVRLTRVEIAGNAAQRVASDDQAVGGSAWEGLALIARSPVLRLFCVYLVLHALLGTVLYFEQTRLAAAAFATAEARTGFFARIDLVVNVLTVITQAVGTSALVRRFGLAVALALLPMLSAIGFSALGMAPTLAVLVVVGIVRRAGEYAIARPAREMVFTVLPRNVKYKAKNLLDTVVVRGADAASSWLVEGARAMAIVGAPLALAAVPVALLGAATGWRLARHPTISIHEEEHHDPTRPADRTSTGPGAPTLDGRHGAAAARRDD